MNRSCTVPVLLLLLAFAFWVETGGAGSRDKSLCLFVNWRPTPSSPSVRTFSSWGRQYIYTVGQRSCNAMHSLFFLTPRAVGRVSFVTGACQLLQKVPQPTLKPTRGAKGKKKKSKIDIFPFFPPPIFDLFSKFSHRNENKTKETKKIKKQEDHVWIDGATGSWIDELV